jgi:pimeloyl-ACP methyl ester carboxylesterase
VLPALVAVLAVEGGGTRNSPQPPTGGDRNPVVFAPGRLVGIGGGRTLYLKCEGSGTPTVVLEAGLGGTSTDWEEVQAPLSRVTRTCAYDRAGLGNSLPIPGIHDAADEVADLERLLGHAGLAPPYVLVGASYGGLVARLFAYGHGQTTAGLVLVDAMVQDQDRTLLAAWRALPANVRGRIPRPGTEPDLYGVDVRAGEALDSGVTTLGALPLVVVTRGRYVDAGPPLPAAAQAAVDRWWNTGQDRLAGLSSDSVHVIALRSGHLVMRTLNGQPDVVVSAALAVIDTARAHRRLGACSALFRGGGTRCVTGP